MANKLVNQINDYQANGMAVGTELLNFIGQHTPFINWLKAHSIYSPFLENQNLIIEALTHSSFRHENKDWPARDNERLEFLGDAVLDAEISKRLFNEYSHFSEGKLSRLRSALVNEEVLARWACILKVDQFIMLGKGEAGKSEVGQAILADAFEALVGALYLIDEQSLGSIIDKWIEIFDQSKLSSKPFFCETRLDDFDPKTRLQEICLENFKKVAHYETSVKDESAQEIVFCAKVFCGDEILGSGEGSNKKKAQSSAAKAGLQSQFIKKLLNNDQ